MRLENDKFFQARDDSCIYLEISPVLATGSRRKNFFSFKASFFTNIMYNETFLVSDEKEEKIP
jgi:hypothetical protein